MDHFTIKITNWTYRCRLNGRRSLISSRPGGGDSRESSVKPDRQHLPVRLSRQVATYPLSLHARKRAPVLVPSSSRAIPVAIPRLRCTRSSPEFLSVHGTTSHATTARQARVGIATVAGEKWRRTASREAAYTLFVVTRDTDSHRQKFL